MRWAISKSHLKNYSHRQAEPFGNSQPKRLISEDSLTGGVYHHRRKFPTISDSKRAGTRQNKFLGAKARIGFRPLFSMYIGIFTHLPENSNPFSIPGRVAILQFLHSSNSPRSLTP